MFIRSGTFLVAFLVFGLSFSFGEPIRVGVIGLDTSHAIAFTKILNNAKEGDPAFGCRVVAAYPQGSKDIESSTRRVPEYTQKMKDMGVEIVTSIDVLLTKVDVVLLESNDGRPHLEQVLPVLKAGKRVFVDKPVAGSLVDAVAMYAAAEKVGVPMFSSSLRFGTEIQHLAKGGAGDVLGCNAFSPASLEKTHPDLFWYGIHGVEILFTVMGTGCEEVVRSKTPGADVVTGTWKDGRVGSFRGTRGGKHKYGGTVFGSKATQHFGWSDGYNPLLVEIVKFFKTGEVPVSPEATLEVYTFMEAADESARRNGAPVKMAEVFAKAKAEAARVTP